MSRKNHKNEYCLQTNTIYNTISFGTLGKTGNDYFATNFNTVKTIFTF